MLNSQKLLDSLDALEESASELGAALVKAFDPLLEFFNHLSDALHEGMETFDAFTWARWNRPKWFRMALHAKKKRIRKKYKDRIRREYRRRVSLK